VSGLRVVVVGGSGNVGTSLLETLAEEPAVDSVLGVSRRRPATLAGATEWAEADIRSDDLAPLFEGADVVVHLAWAIQPSRDERALWATNVHGSARVFRAVGAANVPVLVYASSVGTYSPGPKNRRVDESWAREGMRTSFYSRHKAEVERILDGLERERPSLRVVRLRPGLTFKAGAASGIRRLFAGPFLPSFLVRRGLVPVVPRHPRLRVQAVHSVDVGHAYRLAIIRNVRGAFNIAADPVLDGTELARLLQTRTLPVTPGVLRTAAALSWRLRLQPTPPGWVDLAFAVPLLDSGRAHRELGWRPTRTAGEAFLELFDAIRERAGLRTPPLAPETGGPVRVGEFATGVGARADANAP
jgi:nucleoside-diphosphate-sugar epimerase